MSRLNLMLPLLALASACVADFRTEAPRRTVERTPEVAGRGPRITLATAEARLDFGDAYWELEAEVEPGDAPVDRVTFQFLDNAHEPCPVEWTEVFPGWRDDHWELDWYVSPSVVDPTHDLYSVVVEAIDEEGRRDLTEIWARPR